MNVSAGWPGSANGTQTSHHNSQHVHAHPVKYPSTDWTVTCDAQPTRLWYRLNAMAKGKPVTTAIELYLRILKWVSSFENQFWKTCTCSQSTVSCNWISLNTQSFINILTNFCYFRWMPFRSSNSFLFKSKSWAHGYTKPCTLFNFAWHYKRKVRHWPPRAVV